MALFAVRVLLCSGKIATNEGKMELELNGELNISSNRVSFTGELSDGRKVHGQDLGAVITTWVKARGLNGPVSVTVRVIPLKR